VLEGGQVAVDGVLGRVQVGGDLVQLGLVVVALGAGLLAGVGDGLLDEVGAFVGGDQRFDEGGFELVGG